MSLSGPSLKVLKTFINRANEQYRTAGLHEHQMRVTNDGRVIVPNARAKFGSNAAAAAAPSQPAATGQAEAGAAATARSGAGPTISGLQPTGADGFTLSWQPVEGAKQYGIWQDGVLLGHVPEPTFAGTLGSGSGGVLQVDAVRADGSRSQLTQAVAVAREGDGPVQVGAAKPSSGATAPATAAA